MKELTLDSYIAPTTVFNEKSNCWHPGIKHGLRIFYYKDDSFNTENAAAKCATDLLKQVKKTLNEELGIGTPSIVELT